jgi:hypothetical protein
MKDSNKPKEEMVIAVVWYRPEQWRRVRDIATDADELEANYAEWVQGAEEKLKQLRSSGLRVEKVDVDSEKLVLWCNERGLENNGQARSLYAAERLSELDQKRSLIQHTAHNKRLQRTGISVLLIDNVPLAHLSPGR